MGFMKYCTGFMQGMGFTFLFLEPILGLVFIVLGVFILGMDKAVAETEDVTE